MNKLKSWEIETLMEYLSEYIKGIIQNEKDSSVETDVIMSKKEENLRRYLKELIGEEDD